MSADLNPLHIIQMMVSKDPDENSVSDINMAPIVCRVDFISPLLSQELVNIVDSWHKALTKPPEVAKTVRYLKRNPRLIHRFVPEAFRLIFAGVAIGLLYKYGTHLFSSSPIVLNTTAHLFNLTQRHSLCSLPCVAGRRGHCGG
jgi:hypothetical protein